jgi:serine/threonine protein kinase
MKAGWQNRTNEYYGSGWELDDDLTVLDHIGGTRKVDIYLCKSERLDERVACKVLRPEFRLDFSALEAVQREGELLMRLRHENVVAGYATELLPDPRIAMQYLTGQTLSDALFRGNYEAFALGDVVSIASQLADGLTYLHAQGILHLDVKTSNARYSDGHVTLIDLSVAKEFDPEEPFKDNAGTRDYMAPEQTAREYVGYATDVYGLGVVFYRLLTGGEMPYGTVEVESDETDEPPTKQLDYDSPPVFPSEVNEDVPVEISEVAMRAVALDPEDRYATPAEFKAALLEAFDSG